MSQPRDPPASVLSVKNEREPVSSTQSDELEERRAHHRRLVDAALSQMNIDDIRQLVRQMEDELRE